MSVIAIHVALELFRSVPLAFTLKRRCNYVPYHLTIRLDRWVRTWLMRDIPTNHVTYQFPLDSISLKSRETGGCVEASIIQLTRFRAWWYVDSSWWRFSGPFADHVQEQEDRHWKWVTLVRRCRKNPAIQCAAVQTPDKAIQGAFIYRADGQSLLEPNHGAVFGEYLATAPHNRLDYAKTPL